ncbi:transporter [Lentilactobacillus raoultii]|uniref:Transporter n=1 Tax=Lentilactobacillus raoultii TaxID=1987503 RepID=A0ABW3PJC9_9LACO|nr:transporter [Lentilactobacillus raoultii]
MKKILLTMLSLFIIAGAAIYFYTSKSDTSSAQYNDKTEQFIHKSPVTTLQTLSNKKQGIYYFGFPTCPWCLELLPVFNKALKEHHLKSYVTNTRADNYTSQDNIKLERIFLKYRKEKRLSVPFIIEITKSGKVETHVGTVPGHDAEVQKMTTQQENKLKSQLNAMLADFSN